ncbi:MAG: 50S ribosomal protein L31e [Candidatus Bathyarchaeia archaeon]
MEKPAEEEKEEKLTETEEIKETAEITKEEETEGEEKPEESILEEEMKEEAEAIKEEEKPKPGKEKEEDIVEERFYTIPLRRVWIMPPNKRAPRAIRLIRNYVEKHMKIGVKKEEEATEEEEAERLLISSELNEKIWQRGIRKPPRKVKVRVVKDSEGNITVYPG